MHCHSNLCRTLVSKRNAGCGSNLRGCNFELRTRVGAPTKAFFFSSFFPFVFFLLSTKKNPAWSKHSLYATLDLWTRVSSPGRGAIQALLLVLYFRLPFGFVSIFLFYVRYYCVLGTWYSINLPYKQDGFICTKHGLIF